MSSSKRESQRYGYTIRLIEIERKRLNGENGFVRKKLLCALTVHTYYISNKYSVRRTRFDLNKHEKNTWIIFFDKIRFYS